MAGLLRPRFSCLSPRPDRYNGRVCCRHQPESPCMVRPSFPLVLALALLGHAAVRAADDGLPAIKLAGEDRALARRLTAIDQRAREGKWAEALDAYQQVLAEAG